MTPTNTRHWIVLLNCSTLKQTLEWKVQKWVPSPCLWLKLKFIAIAYTHGYIIFFCILQELVKLRNEKQGLEQELATSQDKWLTERQKLVEQKDSERRKALEEIQEQNEQDYRDFLTEHQDTLNKALKTARDQFTREKVCHNYLILASFCRSLKTFSMHTGSLKSGHLKVQIYFIIWTMCTISLLLTGIHWQTSSTGTEKSQRQTG